MAKSIVYVWTDQWIFTVCWLVIVRIQLFFHPYVVLSLVIPNHLPLIHHDHFLSFSPFPYSFAFIFPLTSYVCVFVCIFSSSVSISYSRFYPFLRLASCSKRPHIWSSPLSFSSTRSCWWDCCSWLCSSGPDLSRFEFGFSGIPLQAVWRSQSGLSSKSEAYLWSTIFFVVFFF